MHAANLVRATVASHPALGISARSPVPPRQLRMPTFQPRLDILPAAPRTLWCELAATPGHFTLYDATPLALRLGHRQSVDFDFFSRRTFDPEALASEVPYLAGAERVQVAGHTLTCRVERGGPVLVSFLGNLGLGEVAPRDLAQGSN